MAEKFKTGAVAYPNELCNPKIQGINRLPARANLIPADKRGVYYKNKEDSPYLQSLNGDYSFAYRECDSIEGFFDTRLDDSGWEKIDVPSMWQFRGYGKCKYPNVEYPFPFDPPYIRIENPVGYYRKRFTARKSERAVIHFGGVDNAFYVYLNGEFIGFSKGSRNPAEFDITDALLDGENLLAVKVFTYSDGSYLENQDMLLASGIFRDVYILHTKRASLCDLFVRPDDSGFDISAELSEADEGVTVEICLDGVVREFAAREHIEARFDIEGAIAWCDECPHLYDLYITLKRDGIPYEVHSKRVGIVSSRIKDGKLLVNESPVYVKGINRHEYDPDNGRAVSVALIERELRLIKENNINFIRCSHYTNNPAFYELCSEIGIMVMDECDLETHGCDITADQGYLSKRPEWLTAYLDRAERSVKQNKNEPCIVMRSVQNECGKGENVIRCKEYLESFCPNIAVIHDQQQTHAELTDVGFVEPNTLLRGGYLSREMLLKILDVQPLFMQIEYAHAMGNSPGFLKGYQDLVYERENYIGGFAWEFKNHGFRQYDECGNAYYLYGGDFGERAHWYNFCLDGYLMSDGTPKHSWYELGAVFAPIYVRWQDGVKIKNTYNFKSLENYRCKWKISEDGIALTRGETALPALLPHRDGMLKIDTDINGARCGADYYLDLDFFEGERFVCSSQIKLSSVAKCEKREVRGIAPSVECVGDTIRVFGEGYSFEFSDGVISSFEKNGKKIIDKPFEFCAFRAHTDNDGIFMQSRGFWREAGEWQEARLDDMRFFAYGMTASAEDGCVNVKTRARLMPIGRYLGFDLDIVYTVSPDGTVLVAITATPYGRLPERLPRFGVHFEIDEAFGGVRYLGRGVRENYSDCKEASPIGIYDVSAADSYTVFDMPQNSGNREDTAFLALTDGGERGLCIVGSDSFAFTYRDVTEEALEVALHKNEVKRDGKNHLYIDYKMRGLGSHSCGPLPEDEFEFKAHAFDFSFLIGAGLSDEALIALKRTDLGARTGRREASDFLAEVGNTSTLL